MSSKNSSANTTASTHASTQEPHVEKTRAHDRAQSQTLSQSQAPHVVPSAQLPASCRLPSVGALHYVDLYDAASRYMSDEQLNRVHDAYLFAADVHKEQKRRSGEPYINHPVEVATILAHDFRMDDDVVCAALLHDTVEDTSATKDDIAKLFDNTVAELVDGVTKLTNIDVSSMDEKQALNLRKMFLAMSKDIRVILIKLADRLHNMRTLRSLPPNRQIFKATETMDVYAPLADRLGMSNMKTELEDLAFSYIEPDEYKHIARLVKETQEQRKHVTANAMEELEHELSSAGIKDFQISGRPKHFWSIYQKMKHKDKDFQDIYDLIALRVLTSSIGDCYAALGAVHNHWHPIPGRFKDYIAMPKTNLYQSLHTTVIGPEGRPIEIQIRTRDMHEQAEYGIAAHWLYKAAGNSEGNMSGEDRDLEEQINAIRKSMEWTVESDIEDARSFLRDLRVDLFEKEVFIFTPKGDVMSLRNHSTPLDFAYAVHTEVGNHCVGARVNGRVVPLTYELQTGDRVEVMTNKNSRPSADWLKLVKTPSARSKIRRYFSSVNKDNDAELGRASLATEMRKRGYGISTRRSTKAIEQVCEHLDLKSPDDLFAAIGTNTYTPKAIVNRIADILEADTHAQDAAVESKAANERLNETFTKDLPMMGNKAFVAGQLKEGKRKNTSGVVVKGDPDLLVHLAHCCNPVAGDDIVGFITRGRGVSVHRATCPNVKSLSEHPERMIDVAWDTSGHTQFQVEIVVEAQDRVGLLKDITIAVGEAGGNIMSAATRVSDSGEARLRFLVAISDASLLDPLLASVSHVPSVFDARRIMPGETPKSFKRRARS